MSAVLIRSFSAFVVTMLSMALCVLLCLFAEVFQGGPFLRSDFDGDVLWPFYSKLLL
jgi:hypothetical protein